MEIKLFHKVLRVGVIEVPPTRPVGCMDLKLLREAIGEDVRGILGIDFFRPHLIEINFDAGTLRILPRDEPMAAWGERIALDESPRGISCTAVMGNHGEVSLLIDTGTDSSITLAGYLFRRLVDLGDVEVRGSALIGTKLAVETTRFGQLRVLLRLRWIMEQEWVIR